MRKIGLKNTGHRLSRSGWTDRACLKRSADSMSPPMLPTEKRCQKGIIFSSDKPMLDSMSSAFLQTQRGKKPYFGIIDVPVMILRQELFGPCGVVLNSIPRRIRDR